MDFTFHYRKRHDFDFQFQEKEWILFSILGKGQEFFSSSNFIFNFRKNDDFDFQFEEKGMDLIFLSPPICFPYGPHNISQ